MIPDEEDGLAIVLLHLLTPKPQLEHDVPVPRALIKARKEIERLRAELARKEAKDGQATDG